MDAYISELLWPIEPEIKQTPLSLDTCIEWNLGITLVSPTMGCKYPELSLGHMPFRIRSGQGIRGRPVLP